MAKGRLSVRDIRMKPVNQASKPAFSRRQFLSLAASGIGLAAAGFHGPAEAQGGTANRYAGMEDSASWRREAHQRIEKLRQGDFSVAVQDPGGRPLPQAQIRLRLDRHQFGFGCSLRLRRAFSDEYPEELRARYRELCAASFHKLVPENALKWKHSAKNEAYVAPFFEWAAANRLPVRGHCLVWPDFDRIPGSLAGLREDPPGLRQAIRERVRQTVARHRGSIVEWDVLNEPYTEHAFMDLLGQDEPVEWFRIAAGEDPEAVRYINDFGVLTRSSERHADFYFDYIRRLLAGGAELQGIGFQSHTPARFAPTAPEALFATLDRFSVLGLAHQVTEFDFECVDQEFQARYIADFLTAIFSHPSTVGLLHWTPFEYATGAVSKPSAALYDKRLAPRPGAIAWNELVNGAWMTDKLVHTDKQGRAGFRGFKGRYAASVSAGSVEQDFNMNFDSDHASVTLTLA